MFRCFDVHRTKIGEGVAVSWGVKRGGERVGEKIRRAFYRFDDEIPLLNFVHGEKPCCLRGDGLL